MATYYVGNRTDLGGAGTEGDPFTCSEIWDAGGAGIAAGDIFLLKDGTYQGANAMLDGFTLGATSIGVVGTAESPITIKAENDGQVLIDGQGSRQPCHIRGAQYITVEGINFGNADSGSGATVEINDHNIGPVISEHITFKRCIAFDADVDANAHVWTVNESDYVLIEDCAAFGTGRKSFVYFQSGTGTSGGANGGGLTLRRFFAQWYKTSRTDPKEAISLSYDGFNVIAENVIATAIPTTGQNTDNQFVVIGMNQQNQTRKYIKVLGSISYLLDNYAGPHMKPFQIVNTGDVEFVNNAAYVHPDINSSVVPYFLDFTTLDPDNIVITDSSSVMDDTASSIHANWASTNFEEATTVGGLTGTIFTDDATGAYICGRYVDGTLTSTPLWPWPMNQRIIDAMTDAGYTAVDVTATIETIFGTIPST